MKQQKIMIAPKHFVISELISGAFRATVKGVEHNAIYIDDNASMVEIACGLVENAPNTPPEIKQTTIDRIKIAKHKDLKRALRQMGFVIIAGKDYQKL